MVGRFERDRHRGFIVHVSKIVPASFKKYYAFALNLIKVLVDSSHIAVKLRGYKFSLAVSLSYRDSRGRHGIHNWGRTKRSMESSAG